MSTRDSRTTTSTSPRPSSVASASLGRADARRQEGTGTGGARRRGRRRSGPDRPRHRSRAWSELGSSLSRPWCRWVRSPARRPPRHRPGRTRARRRSTPRHAARACCRRRPPMSRARPASLRTSVPSTSTIMPVGEWKASRSCPMVPTSTSGSPRRSRPWRHRRLDDPRQGGQRHGSGDWTSSSAPRRAVVLMGPRRQGRLVQDRREVLAALRRWRRGPADITDLAVLDVTPDGRAPAS